MKICAFVDMSIETMSDDTIVAENLRYRFFWYFIDIYTISASVMLVKGSYPILPFHLQTPYPYKCKLSAIFFTGSNISEKSAKIYF